MQKTLLAAAICQVLVSNFSGSSYTFGGVRILSAREHESDEPQAFALPEGEAQALAEYLKNENPHIQVEVRPFLPESGSDSEDADSANAELTDAAQTASSLTEDQVAGEQQPAADEPAPEQTAATETAPADANAEQQSDASGTDAAVTGEAQTEPAADAGTENVTAEQTAATETAPADSGDAQGTKRGRQKAQ